MSLTVAWKGEGRGWAVVSPAPSPGSPAATSCFLCCVSFQGPFNQVPDRESPWRPHQLKSPKSDLLTAQPEGSCPAPDLPRLASLPLASVPLVPPQEKCKFTLKLKKLTSRAYTAPARPQPQGLGKRLPFSLCNFNPFSF